MHARLGSTDKVGARLTAERKTVGVMMRGVLAFIGISAFLAAPAAASECANPDALGVERTVVIDATEHPRIGTMQYPETLPLHDKEVVLTFDDGPLPPYTNRVLQALAAECVKATFFLVGRQSRAYPEMVRRVYNEGHTVASHSQNHPLIFTRLPKAGAEREIEQGIESATAALGDPRALAPFFRFPGLGRSQAIEAYLASRQIMVWSADFPADDWTRISPKAVMARALDRLERKGKGVLLLHDIQPRTVLMLPTLLRELKHRGYKVVHIVPATVDRPKTVTEPESWVFHRPMRQGWPRIVEQPYQLPAPSAESFGWPHPFRIREAVAMPQVVTPPVAATARPHAWSPTPHVSLVKTVEPSTLTPTPTATFGDPPVEPAATAPLAEPVTGVVASPDVLAEMIAPAAWVPRPKARPAPKARVHGPVPVVRPIGLRPPLSLPPGQVARTAQTAR
jgi:peptidoglycan/xylan/chitin deacetylase (PgdA/CDA1 family)